MFKPLAALLVPLLMLAAGAAPGHPFTAKDLALLERVSDPRVSPAGRFVAYNVRSTDWDGTRGLNALWVLERGSAHSPPRLIRDQEKSATSPRWSADGRWLYFLSSRSGSVQIWRTSPAGADAKPMTNLPLDVGLYRVAADDRQFVVAITAHADCATLACSKAADEAKAKEKPSGTLYDNTAARFWDMYLDGRYSGLFAVAAGGDTPATDGIGLRRT